MEACLRE